MRYVGIDLHSTKATAYFDEGEKGGKTLSWYMTKGGMEKVIEKELKEEDIVFLEASTNTFAFCDEIEGKVKETIVVDPFQFRGRMKQGKKTDKVDARKLAEVGRYHIETGGHFLPTVYIVDKDIRKLRSLFTTYNVILKEINMIKNRIHSIFRQNLKKWNGKESEEELGKDLKGSGMEEGYKYQVRALFGCLRELLKAKEGIKKEILLSGEKYKEDIDIIVSISGISVFGAIAMISDYVNVERFKNAKNFCKYLRSTPRTEESNEKRKNGKTEKNGRKLSIKLILQGIAHIWKEKWNLRNFYFRLRKAKGACRARVALARRIFTIIYYMLKTKRHYNYMNKVLHKRKMIEYENFLKANKVIKSFST